MNASGDRILYRATMRDDNCSVVVGIPQRCALVLANCSSMQEFLTKQGLRLPQGWNVNSRAAPSWQDTEEELKEQIEILMEKVRGKEDGIDKGVKALATYIDDELASVSKEVTRVNEEDTDAIDEIEPQQGPVGPPVHSMSKLT